MFADVYSNKRVLITGNTGFKGSWLTVWLLSMGADVAGYSVNVPSKPSNFEVLGLKNRIKHYIGDVRDRKKLEATINDFKPEIIFHLAAQAQVRKSYADPVTTFETNAIGTMNVLECLRTNPFIRAGIIITSDKCYRNVEWVWGYRENDVLGGEDPYSGSKGCAELIFHSYVSSFFKGNDKLAFIASARAGNVIGGGDWAEDRIVPDCIRSWSEGKTVAIRNPNATRPWQHVLEPLSGYLWLGSNLYKNNQKVKNMSYNFGPASDVNQSVERLIGDMSRYWSNACWAVDSNRVSNMPESNLLKLCCDKALADLSWQAVLPFKETVKFTSQWYQKYYNGDVNMLQFTFDQIKEYCTYAEKKNLMWVKS